MWKVCINLDNHFNRFSNEPHGTTRDSCNYDVRLVRSISPACHLQHECQVVRFVSHRSQCQCHARCSCLTATDLPSDWFDGSFGAVRILELIMSSSSHATSLHFRSTSFPSPTTSTMTATQPLSSVASSKLILPNESHPARAAHSRRNGFEGLRARTRNPSFNCCVCCVL